MREALFRGGLTPETLAVLIAGANTPGVESDDQAFQSWDKETFSRPAPISVTVTKPTADQLTPDPSEVPGNNGYLSYPQPSYGRSYSFGAANTSLGSPDPNEQYTHPSPGPRPPHNGQRTILFTNLAENTTHKELTEAIRGGRLLDVYLRNDKSATVSFVEGAADFMAYAKRNDIYIHTKRVRLIILFSWNLEINDCLG